MEQKELSLVKDMDADQGRPDSDVWEEEMQVMMGAAEGTGPRLSVPPTPPPKDIRLVQMTPVPHPQPLNTTPRPVTASSQAAKSARSLPLRAPLGMNPPTRPGTAKTEASRVEIAPTTQARIVGSNKRLSWSSYGTSKRIIKYGRGKHSNVELNPQPSDDPEDPLVRHTAD